MCNKSKDTLPKYGHLKLNDLFSTMKSTISDDSVTIVVHNVMSLSKHADNIVSDNKIISNYAIVFTETQINPSDSTSKIIETVDFFNINFNNNEIEFLSLDSRCRKDVAALDKFSANEVSISNLLTEYLL